MTSRWPLASENPTADFSQDNGGSCSSRRCASSCSSSCTTLIIDLGRAPRRRPHAVTGPARTAPARSACCSRLADGVKLALKEDIMPKAADKAVFCSRRSSRRPRASSRSPSSRSARWSDPFGDIQTPLQLTDLPVAVLYVLAIASVGVYGIVLAGWSSGSTYPLLGGAALVRAGDLLRDRDGPVARQRLPLRGLDVDVGDRRRAGHGPDSSASTSAPSWYARLLPAFVIYCISMVGETNRAPFDLPEAEGELVGGFHTEYSSLKFALFFLAEYVNMVTVSAIATTLFLGGWRAPWPLSLWDGANAGWWPVLWFLVKLWCSSSSSSGCAARCRGCATTSSCASAGRSSSRSR